MSWGLATNRASVCRACAANSALGTGVASFANKFYAKNVWLGGTGPFATAANHLAVQGTFNGEETHKYQIVLEI